MQRRLPHMVFEQVFEQPIYFSHTRPVQQLKISRFSPISATQFRGVYSYSLRVAVGQPRPGGSNRREGADWHGADCRPASYPLAECLDYRPLALVAVLVGLDVGGQRGS
jgi:hypothetical protein